MQSKAKQVEQVKWNKAKANHKKSNLTTAEPSEAIPLPVKSSEITHAIPTAFPVYTISYSTQISARLPTTGLHIEPARWLTTAVP